MTAVFLGGGAGVAMADEAQSPSSDLGTGIDLSKDKTVQQVRGVADGVLGHVPFFTHDPLGTHQPGRDHGGRDGHGHDGRDGHDHDGRHHDRHAQHSSHENDGRDCGCGEDEVKQEESKSGQDCPEDQSAPAEDSKDTGSEDTESKDTGSDETESVKSDSTPKVESITPIADTSKVESASTSPESDQVESASTSADDTTPVGSADTGDGSFSPGFTPTFAPAASATPMGEQAALVGGVAALVLAGGYGATMASRRRTGAHRG